MQPGELRAPGDPEDQIRRAQGDQIAEQHADDQIQRDSDLPQEDHQHDEYGDRHEDHDSFAVALRDVGQVAQAGRRADEVQLRALELLGQTYFDVVLELDEPIEALSRQRIVFSHQIEPRNMALELA